ncbi:MAG: 50S ribosomal protein L18 [bacterium]|nr:50S ribosomal protein L18 [bacterium]
MSELKRTKTNQARRTYRVRQLTKGTTERPRLSVNVSNMHVSAQIIDDSNNTTLAAVTSASNKAVKGSLTEKAEWVGSEVAKKAKAAKIKAVVFDRGSRLYHGRIKALADAARKEGLEF